jgi:hypothetical protein
VATSNGFAAALPAGKLIGPGEAFAGGYRTMAKCTYRISFTNSNSFYHTIQQGPWLKVSPGYLGLKFKVNGKIHYGWARFTNMGCFGGTLTGYAYETIPGKAIIAGATKGPSDPEPTTSLNTPTPEPATLGALAMGAPGLSIRRRKESALQGN